jgi:hypothetical protein
MTLPTFQGPKACGAEETCINREVWGDGPLAPASSLKAKALCRYNILLYVHYG